MQVKVTPPPAHITHPTTSRAAKGEEAALLSSFARSVSTEKLHKCNTPGTERLGTTQALLP